MTAARVRNAMSIDVEDYFHVSNFQGVVSRDSWESRESRIERNTDRLLDLFAESRVRATFFVLGWAAERLPSLVARIAAGGHEVASHGHSHRLIYEMSMRGFREDVRRAKAVLEQVAGRAVTGYRAPSFSVTHRSLWALDILVEEGYLYDASVYPVRHDRYGIPDAPRHPHVVRRPPGAIVEIPGATVRVLGANVPVGGGGYFRMLPYALTRWGISHVNAFEGRPVVFYLHPWELDPDQPRLAAGWLPSLRHYRNLGRTEPRLRRLLRDFDFGPVSDLVVAAVQPTVVDAPRHLVLQRS